jgi:8-oxo-dGTP pyrophosphatase MutT (NUDIX family)
MQALPTSAYVFFCFQGMDGSRWVMIGTKHHNCPNNGGQRAIPGGRVNHGEDALAAAIRETEEETGIVLPAYVPNAQLMVDNMGCHYRMNNFPGGFGVLYVCLSSGIDLVRICQTANNNLPFIPRREREFTGFEIVTLQQALQSFANEDRPNDQTRRTTWFTEAANPIW